MKKIGTLLVFIFMLVLISCSTEFDLEQCKQDILAQEGWHIIAELTTEEELNDFEERNKNQWKALDNYIVDHLEYSYVIVFNNNEDFSSSEFRACNIIVCSDKESADACYDWCVNYRGEDSIWRTARHGNIVIDTNDETLRDVIGLKFK